MTSTGLSGRSDDHIEVTDHEIDPAVVLGLAHHRRAGAVVLFLGTVRDHAPGRDGVTHLEYEAYGLDVRPPAADFDDVARLEVVAEGDHTLIDAGTDAMVSNIGMDEVGEVEGGRATGQFLDLAFRAEYVCVRGGEIFSHAVH